MLRRMADVGRMRHQSRLQQTVSVSVVVVLCIALLSSGATAVHGTARTRDSIMQQHSPKRDQNKFAHPTYF